GTTKQGYGGSLEQFGKMFGSPASPAERPQPSGNPDLFGQMSEMIQRGAFPGMPGFPPAAQPQRREEPSAPPPARNPLEELFQVFLGGLAGKPAGAADTRTEQATPDRPPAAPFDREAIGRMFEAGRDIQEQQIATMRAILDSFTKNRG